MKIETVKKLIGKELMLLRKDRELTSEELASLSNISTSTISRYENGAGAMSLDILIKLIISLDSDVFIFFKNAFAKMQNKNNDWLCK